MKKFICLMLAIIAGAIVFTACSSGNTSAKAYEGKYVPVQATVDGVVFTADEIPRDDVIVYYFTLSSDGVALISFDENPYDELAEAAWSMENGQIKMTNEMGTVTGDILDQDTIKFKNILGKDKDVVFAREGTEAATDTSRYLSDRDKSMVGTWQSDDVRDAYGNDLSATIDPASFKMILNDDHSAKISVTTVCQNAVNQWHAYTGTGFLDGDYISGTDHIIRWQLNGDTMYVTYTTSEKQYTLRCHRQ